LLNSATRSLEMPGNEHLERAPHYAAVQLVVKGERRMPRSRGWLSWCD